MDRRQKQATLISIVTSIIWGFSFMFTRSVVVRIPFLYLLSWRFLVAFLGFLLLLALGVYKMNLKGKKLMPLIYIAIAEPLVFFTCESIALLRTSTTETSLMISTIPIAAMIVGVFVAKEMPTAKQAVAIVLSVIGVIVIILGKSLVGLKFDIIGYLVLTVAVFSGAIFSALSAKYHEYSSVEKSFIMILLGLLGFGSAALVQSIRTQTTMEWLTLPFRDSGFLTAILYLGFLASIVCYVGQNYSISVIGLNRNVSFAGVTTLTSVLAGVFILKESFTASMLLGGIMVLIGVYGANYYTPQREEKTQSVPDFDQED